LAGKQVGSVDTGTACHAANIENNNNNNNKPPLAIRRGHKKK
jgi:hypothetical protein